MSITKYILIAEDDNNLGNLLMWHFNLMNQLLVIVDLSTPAVQYIHPPSLPSSPPPLCLSSFALSTQLPTLYQQPSELWMVSVLFPVSPPPASGGQLPGKWGEGGSEGVRVWDLRGRMDEGGDWNEFPADLTAVRSFAMQMYYSQSCGWPLPIQHTCNGEYWYLIKTASYAWCKWVDNTDMSLRA